MPSRKEAKPTSDTARKPGGYSTLDVDAVVLTNLRTFMEFAEAEEADQVEVAKTISCEFYRSGGCPTCRFCTQPTHQVLECSESYRSRITIRPQLEWTPEFEKDFVKKRDKVKFAELETEIGLSCDSCYLSASCPHFEEQSSCAIDWAMPVETLGFSDIINYLISLQSQRVMRAMSIEMADGGVPDALLSAEMQRLADLSSYLQPKQSGVKLTFEAHGGDETTKAAAGGILTKLFASPSPTALPAAREEEAEVLILPDKHPVKEKL